MRSIVALVLASMLVSATAAAQPGEPPAETLAAMAKLGFLAGSWRGDAWIQMGPGVRHDITQTETVTVRMDGVVLTIEGEGRLRDEPEKVIHRAFGTITYDPSARHYVIYAVRMDGNRIEAKGTMSDDGVFEWGFDMMGGKVRYRIRRSANDEWLETGEFSSDGAAWNQFMDMKLTRAK